MEKTSWIFHCLTSTEPSEMHVFCLDPSEAIGMPQPFPEDSSSQLEPQYSWRYINPSHWRKGRACKVEFSHSVSPHLRRYCEQHVMHREPLQSTINTLSCKAETPWWATSIATHRDVPFLSPSFTLLCIAWTVLKVQEVLLVQKEPVLTLFTLHTYS